MYIFSLAVLLHSCTLRFPPTSYTNPHISVIHTHTDISLTNVLPHTIYTALTVQFNPSSYTVTEGDSAALIVVLNRESTSQVVVTLTTEDETALSKHAFWTHTLMLKMALMI